MRAPMEPSDWGSRVGAYLIDVVCAGLLALAAYVLVGALTGGVPDDTSVEEENWWAVAAFWTAFVNYSPMLAARKGKRSGQTLGRQALGIRAVRTDGRRLSFGRALWRHLAHMTINVIPLVGLLNHLWPLWDKRNQTLHDKLAGTLVVDAAWVPADHGLSAVHPAPPAPEPGRTSAPPAPAAAAARVEPEPQLAPDPSGPERPGGWEPPAGSGARPSSTAPSPAPAAFSASEPAPRRTGSYVLVGAVCALVAAVAVWVAVGDAGDQGGGGPSGAAAAAGTPAQAETPEPTATATPRPKPEIAERPRLDIYKLVRRLRAGGDIDRFEPIKPRRGYHAGYRLDGGEALVFQKVVRGGKDELMWRYRIGSSIDPAIEREANKLGFKDPVD
jgi:uncharacterized RDD family membrane protein YckC